MANPQIPQGTLNRLRTSVLVPDFPQLNITSPFLTKDSVRLARSGNTTLMLQTLTGTATSPEPYVMMTATCHILKTNGLAQLYELQILSDSRIGDVTVITDTVALGQFTMINSSIETVNELNFSGTDLGYIVVLAGYYPINSNLYSGI